MSACASHAMSDSRLPDEEVRYLQVLLIGKQWGQAHPHLKQLQFGVRGPPENAVLGFLPASSMVSKNGGLLMLKANVSPSWTAGRMTPAGQPQALRIRLKIETPTRPTVR